MNWLDAVFLICALFAVVAGWRKGLTRQIIGLGALLLAILCGFWFYGTVAGMLKPHVGSATAANLLGFGLIFVGVIVLGHLVAALVVRFLKVVHLSGVDRMMGAGFSLLRWTLAIAAVLLVVMAFAPFTPRALAESRAAPYIVGVGRAVVTAAPRELRDGFRRSYEKLARMWAERETEKY